MPSPVGVDLGGVVLREQALQSVDGELTVAEPPKFARLFRGRSTELVFVQ